MTTSTRLPVIAGTLAALALPAAASAAGIGVSVSPGQMILPGGDAQTLTVANPASTTARIAVSVGDYDILRSGRVVVDPPKAPWRSARRWVRVSPSVLTLPPGARGTVAVAALPSRVAAPGDHHALILLSSDGSGRGPVAVRARVGVPVQVRIGGELRRRLAVRRVSVARRASRPELRVTIANLGNVNERLLSGQVRVELRRGSRVLDRLTAAPVNVLPGRGVVARIPYRGRVRGPVTAVAVVQPLADTQAGPAIATTPSPVRRAQTVRL